MYNYYKHKVYTRLNTKYKKIIKKDLLVKDKKRILIICSEGKLKVKEIK